MPKTYIDVICENTECKKHFKKLLYEVKRSKHNYCSAECALRANAIHRTVEKVTVICSNPNCGKSFKRKPYHVNKDKPNYCSPSCASMVNNSLYPKKTRFSLNAHDVRLNCRFCGKELGKCNLSKHEKSCYLNPTNLTTCSVCGKPVKNYKTNETCSYACANTLFRSGNNNGSHIKALENGDSYRVICFEHHKKECIICGEQLIVAVHHYDHNKKNNSPNNLIPMCPTHHAYMHSSYKYLIEKQVDYYVKEFISGWQESNLLKLAPKASG